MVLCAQRARSLNACRTLRHSRDTSPTSSSSWGGPSNAKEGSIDRARKAVCSFRRFFGTIMPESRRIHVPLIRSAYPAIEVDKLYRWVCLAPCTTEHRRRNKQCNGEILTNISGQLIDKKGRPLDFDLVLDRRSFPPGTRRRPDFVFSRSG